MESLGHEKSSQPLGKSLTIPQEIIYEIFSWLPVKSLVRYRCVSKFCNSLVFESRFVDIHHRRSMIRPGGMKYLICVDQGSSAIQLKEGDYTSGVFYVKNGSCYENHILEISARGMVSVNGLVCSYRPFERSLMKPAKIYNLTTREERVLPCSPQSTHTSLNQLYSIGFEPEEKKHKIWCHTVDTSGQVRKNWVLTLGIDKSWREIRSGVLFRPTVDTTSIYANGVIYVMSYYNKLVQIVAFDVKTETFRTITVPDFNEYVAVWCLELIMLKGKLALLNIAEMDSSEGIHLRILVKEGHWESHRSFSIASQLESMNLIRFLCTSSTTDEEIVFEGYDTKLRAYIYICYHVTRKNWRVFEFQDCGERELRGMYCYVENLFALGFAGLKDEVV